MRWISVWRRNMLVWRKLLAASVLFNAPLTERANPNQTPNPSKAPWYFLNLQELLLHMNAGVGSRGSSGCGAISP